MRPRSVCTCCLDRKPPENGGSSMRQRLYVLFTAGRLQLRMADLRVALMRRTPIKRKEIFGLKCLLAIDPIRAVYSGPALMGCTRSSVSDAAEGQSAARRDRGQAPKIPLLISATHRILLRLRRSIHRRVTQQHPRRTSCSVNRASARVVFRTMSSASLRAPAIRPLENIDALSRSRG